MVSPEYVPTPKFEDYKEQFKEHFIMERKNGIILVRMHTDSGSVTFTHALHNAWGQVWHTIGNDPENEVMILTTTGQYWIKDRKPEEKPNGLNYGLYHDATKLIENLIFDIDIPTIAAVNGPSWWHSDIILLCDITICTEDTVFQDAHFMGGSVPGDGQSLVFQGLLGIKRTAYYMYTSKTIDAKTALEWGLVNEVVPRERLTERAWELAEIIMKQPRAIRRLTSQLVRRPWKRLLIDDFQDHTGHEFYASHAKDKA